MKKRATPKQKMYAFGLMNLNKTKQQIALESGFSASTARVPQLIENKVGFKLAMAQLASEAGNVAMQVFYELKTRDLAKEDTKTLLYSVDVLSKAFERFTPKEKTFDSGMSESTIRLREVLINHRNQNKAA